ncbi:MAG: hypothetical protein WD981_07945 [Gaiellaceae bacterium]
MTTTPDYLTLKEHRDDSHAVERAARWTVIGLLAAIGVAALLNVFGERPTTTKATGAAAELTVAAPDRLRGGLFYQGRISVLARERLEDAVIVLDAGWAEQTHINTIEPSPIEESGKDGRLALGYGELEAGERLVVYLQLQVNPTNVGRRSQRVELRDGPTLVAAANRTITVFP